jgi:hypothetical protein
MAVDSKRDKVENALGKGGGILRLKPAWVARDFLPAGYRLGLNEEEANMGERGVVAERWLGSITKADNAIGPDDEGLSYVVLEEGDEMTLKDAVDAAGAAVMGAEYAKTHPGLGRLAKIYDFGCRIPYHIHQMKDEAAKLGRNSKEEAYYFPEGVDMGPHPETFFGVHPYIVEQKKYDVLLPHLVEWKDDLILRHAYAYQLVADDGFHIPSGVLHAPGTAVTIELQEDSDVFAMLQALNGGKIISKELLFKDVHPDDRAKYGERAVLNQIDWELSGDLYFYENRHTPPVLIEESKQPGGEEYWIYYNTTTFSGKKLIVKPGQKYVTQDKGVYNILVWKGEGIYGGYPISSKDFNLQELIISHDRAVQPIEVENTGTEDLMIIKFFGPDINPDCPRLPKYPA